MILAGGTSREARCHCLLPLSEMVETESQIHLGICQSTFEEQGHRATESLKQNPQNIGGTHS